MASGMLKPLANSSVTIVAILPSGVAVNVFDFNVLFSTLIAGKKVFRPIKVENRAIASMRVPGHGNSTTYCSKSKTH